MRIQHYRQPNFIVCNPKYAMVTNKCEPNRTHTIVVLVLGPTAEVVGTCWVLGPPESFIESSRRIRNLCINRLLWPTSLLQPTWRSKYVIPYDEMRLT
jgi:hypothetical protein